MLTKLFPYSILLVGVMALSAHPPVRNQAEGEWLVAEGSSKITLAPCGDKFCGKITWLKNTPAPGSGPGLGTLILKDFTITDERTLEKGQIYDLPHNKWYKGRLQVGDDGRLEVRGWLGIPALGKSVYWTKVK